jgi:hypothetical protein
VATSGFNASTEEAVQVGGVYTLPALRGKGFARAIVPTHCSRREHAVSPRRSCSPGKSHHARNARTCRSAVERIGDFRISLLS